MVAYRTVKDVAQTLGVSPDTVRRYIRRGLLDAILLPGRLGYRIDVFSLAAFCEAYQEWLDDR